MASVIERAYPETAAGGFSAVDGTVQFYTRVNALLRPEMTVLDFGAGRGQAFDRDDNAFRRRLQTLKGKVRKVVGADLDPVVRDNPGLDEAVVLAADAPLPFEDEAFDLIVSDHTFEHIVDPLGTAAELGRVLKAGGWLCARTPNKWGSSGIGARLVPNRAHVAWLRRLQPGREARDVFPVAYRLNTRAALARAFPPEHFVHATYGWNAEPAYVGDSLVLLRIFQALHWLGPPAMRDVWLVFLRKR